MPRQGDAMAVLLRPGDVGAVLLRPTNAEIVAWAANATLAGRFPARRAQGTAPFARQLASRISFPQVTRGCLGTVRRAVATMPRRCPTTAVSGARLSNYRETSLEATFSPLIGPPCGRALVALAPQATFAKTIPARVRRSHRWRVRSSRDSSFRARWQCARMGWLKKAKPGINPRRSRRQPASGRKRYDA